MKRARRAAAACHTCHKRKVRCDALIHGQPCTNCRIDGRDDCTVRTKPQGIDRPRRVTNSATSSTKGDKLSKISQGEIELFKDQDTAPYAISGLNNHDSGTVPKGNVLFSSYRFLDGSRLCSLPSEDVEFLLLKRCLHFPRKDALDEFVKQYFAMVHPFLPLIDEAEFWRHYSGLGSKTISLFVFQAMLFSASSFVSLDTLQKCGFADKRNARSELHKRAKILFDLRGEDRQIYRAQGSVLLSQQTSADDPHSGSLWIAQALRTAMTLTSHPLIADLEDANQSVLKRLWWSILLRDRSLSLGLRRHPQLTSVEFMTTQTWILTESDFEDEFRYSQVYSESVKRQLFSALQEQCHLAVLLTDALSILFAAPGPSAKPYAIEATKNSNAILLTAKEKLSIWKQESKCSPTSLRAEKSQKIVLHFAHITYMYYYTAKISIAHHEAMVLENQMQQQQSVDEYQKRLTEIGQDLRISIDGLSKVIDYFYSNRSLVVLPLSVLAFAGIPLVLAAIDLKLSPSHMEMVARRHRLDSFAQMVQRFQDLYEVADVVVAGTNHLLQLAYAITKNLFLSRRLMPSASQIARSNPKEINRPTTWNEAFLCYPRAYLYISTSVEYSFSFGRIPSESLLPDQVRHVPSLIFGSQIPLTVDQPCAKPSQRADVDTEANCTADLSSWMLDLDGTGNDGNNHSHVPAVMLSPSQTVNLDYFDIEPVCPESAEPIGKTHTPLMMPILDDVFGSFQSPPPETVCDTAENPMFHIMQGDKKDVSALV